MLQRLAIHITLIFLFAFTQIGVATHEISHVVDAKKHSEQEKNTAIEQCAQCISYAKVANGLQLSSFNLTQMASGLSTIIVDDADFQSYPTTAYVARAPPQITSI